MWSLGRSSAAGWSFILEMPIQGLLNVWALISSLTGHGRAGKQVASPFGLQE